MAAFSSAEMAYLLKIDVSPMGNSKSREVGETFLAAFKSANPDIEIRLKDLSVNPVPHLDGEALSAAYVPEEKRSDGMKTKHALRLELIKEIVEAQSVVITTPMWNWSIPSVLKAYIDHIVFPGHLDPFGEQKLAGKKITIILATGSDYSESSSGPADYASCYVKQVFGALGCLDVQVIRTDFGMAGMAGMESMIPLREASIAAGKAAAQTRAAEAL